jgi:hypothetical protein
MQHRDEDHNVDVHTIPEHDDMQCCIDEVIIDNVVRIVVVGAMFMTIKRVHDVTLLKSFPLLTLQPCLTKYQP